MNKLFFDELAFDWVSRILFGVVWRNLGRTMGNVFGKFIELFDAEKPDAILVLGDTNSCFA
jgi:UDP-N-acetylglucosamine 2-epimerase (non-hydrolysing)